MKKYHKINGLWKRDTKGKVIDWDEYSKPEFGYLYYNHWMWTEKIDGMNIRVQWDPESSELLLCGRGDNSQIPTPLIAHMREAFPIARLHVAYPDFPLTFYGEGYGGSIQKAGKTYGGQQRFILFDVLVGDSWLERDNLVDVAEKMKLEVVPATFYGSIADARALVQGGLASKLGDFEAEGLVGTPIENLFNRYGERIITKIKAKDFR